MSPNDSEISGQPGGNGYRSPASAVQQLLFLVYFIYFFCGMTQSFESVILPELKEYFHLGYQQQMYVVFAKNIPFLLCPLLPLFIQRAGYLRSLTAAMAMYAAGTFLLVVGLQTSVYGILLLGFATIGAGFTLQMVVGNPLIGALGPQDGVSSRLNLGNALGAVAQILAPAALTIVVPATAIAIQDKLPRIVGLLIVLAVVLGGIALVTYSMRRLFAPDSESSSDLPQSESGRRSVWKNTAVLTAALMIFLVLGAEASLFSFFRNFLEDPKIASLSSHQSERLFTLYFALFAAGRLSAAWLQRRVTPALHLLVSLAAALVAVGVLLLVTGVAAVVAVLALGFFVSIFFPTLFALTLCDAGQEKTQASGLLTIGFLGAAITPVLQGRLADYAGLQRSYLLDAFIYLCILVLAGRLYLRQRTTATRETG